MLFWPALLVAVLTYREWRAPEPVTPLSETRLSNARVQHPVFHPIAVRALARYRALPRPQQRALKQNLRQALQPLDQWLTELEAADPRVLCVGELHRPATRRFLARQLFARLPVDVLLLEADPAQVRRLRERTLAGDALVGLRGADAAELLRAALARNPRLALAGIEERQRQARSRGGQGNRDRSIAVNFWNQYRNGARHAILYGALHCSHRPHRLFGRLRADAPPALRRRMLNLQVLGEHQDGPLEAFVYFLDELDLAPGHFAVADTGALHPLVYRWFGLLNQQVFSEFATLVVFRSPGAGLQPDAGPADTLDESQ